MSWKTHNLGLVNGVSLNTLGMDFPIPPYPYGVGLDQNYFQGQGQLKFKPNLPIQDLFREQPELQCKLTRYPNVYSVDEHSLDVDVGKQMNDHLMNSRYHNSMDTSEEKLKKELHEFEGLIRHDSKICDFSYEMSQPVQPLPFSKAPEIVQMSSPGFDVSSSLRSTLNASAGYGTLDNNSTRNCNSYRAVKSSFHNGSNFYSSPPSGYNIHMRTSVSCVGNNICTNETAKQNPFDVVPSPDHVPSVIACSYLDRQSDDVPIDGGAVIMDNDWQHLPEVSQNYLDGSKSIRPDVLFNYQTRFFADPRLGLEGNMEVPYCMRGSDQVVGRLSSECKVYPSVDINRTTSGSEEVPYSQSQIPGRRQCCYQPINLLDCQSDIQSQNCLVTPGELPKLVDSCNVSSHDILLQYKKYKSFPANLGVPLLSFLHWTNCSSERCLCKQFQLLVDHFDKCNDSSCRVCDPPLGFSNNNVSSASGISNNSFSTVGDDQPLAKRMRVENLLSPYNGELTAPRGSVPENQEMIKKSKEFSMAGCRRAVVHQDVATNNNQQMVQAKTQCFAEEVNQGYKFLRAEQISTTEMETAATTNNVKVSLENHTVGLESEKKDVVSSGDSKIQTTSCLNEHEDSIGLQESKKVGAALIDILTADLIEEHLQSLGNVTNENSTDENSCQLCPMRKLMFRPAHIYCSRCPYRFKRKEFYHWTSNEMGVKYCFCGKCLRESKGEIISFEGHSFCKSKLTKTKNIKEDEEPWVQCDKCERWQHQICGLYNPKDDSEGKAKYICPCCRLKEIKNGEHMPLSNLFGAYDLPCTKLSDHIEQRLQRRLNEERQERATTLGKCVDEVPGAENLVVRVALSVRKSVKVKQQFLDIIPGENYPTEFPYKSKVILLFQKIKGVDVCLFAMSVQEYGSDCLPPNRRSVYISYVDSVKYFQPEIRTVHGEALRTFVYHEILIGYLEYCRKLDLETCYIWASPPRKGDDYLFNCHPESQKTPESDNLRHWYKSMLLKATKENVVSDCTNLYDRFFVSNGQCGTKVTAANLPYFDGAYWPGEAEDKYRDISEQGGGSEEMVKKDVTARALKSMGYTNPSSESATNILVMHELGEKILKGEKENFIVVNLQSASSITEDEDVDLDNDIFGSRDYILSFCRENFYQFGSLRHAKYSSMMILYYLHKKLTQCPSMPECATTNKRVLQKQKPAQELEEILKTLVHALQCRHSKEDPCSYSRCSRLRKLFHHVSLCNSRVDGGCKFCKIAWNLLYKHSRHCEIVGCQVPNCRSLKMSRGLKATEA